MIELIPLFLCLSELFFHFRKEHLLKVSLKYALKIIVLICFCLSLNSLNGQTFVKETATGSASGVDWDNALGVSNFDGVETVADNGILNYSIADSETTPDGIFDAYEIDADGDSCFHMN